jgi:hypothetical protein
MEVTSVRKLKVHYLLASIRNVTFPEFRFTTVNVRQNCPCAFLI